MKNYYDILGVDEKATSSDINKAFKELAKKHHPDRGGAKDKFQEISEAHDTLKDSQKRHDYDTMRKFGTSVGALASSGLRFKSVEGNVKAMKAVASLETYSSIRAAEEGTPPMNIMGRAEGQQLAMIEMAGMQSAKEGTTKGFLRAFDKLSHERQVSLIEFLHAWGMEHEENM